MKYGILHEITKKQEGFLMSIFLTVIGTWIGNRQVNIEPIRMFFYKWPRNFAISFAIESCIAQPIARAVMLKMHQVKQVENYN